MVKVPMTAAAVSPATDTSVGFECRNVIARHFLSEHIASFRGGENHKLSNPNCDYEMTATGPLGQPTLSARRCLLGAIDRDSLRSARDQTRVAFLQAAMNEKGILACEHQGEERHARAIGAAPMSFQNSAPGMAINPLEHMCDLMCHGVRQECGQMLIVQACPQH